MALLDVDDRPLARGYIPGTYIQIVPALPRTGAGQVRADIRQRIAANQVDAIDALITSEADGAAVVPVLTGRLNFGGRSCCRMWRTKRRAISAPLATRPIGAAMVRPRPAPKD